MKTNRGQTQTQTQQNSAATQAAQKKKALSETLEFEDQRESSQAQSDLQSGIEQSPRMMVQRKQIANAFGLAIQRQSSFPFLQKKSSKRQDALQRETPVPRSNGSSTNVVQREPGDERILEPLRHNGHKAKVAFELLCTQAEVAENQMRLLNLQMTLLKGVDDEKLQAAKNEIAASTARFTNVMADFCSKGDKASAKAMDVGAKASGPLVSRDYMLELSEQSARAMASLTSVLAQSGGTLVRIKEEALKVVQVAMKVEDISSVRNLLKVADACHAEATRGDSVIVDLNANDKVKSSGKEKAANVVGHLDTTNNVATGVGFSMVSIVDMLMGASFVLSVGAALALGLIGGILGVVFGAIGIFLGVKSFIRGKQKQKALKDAKGMLSNDDLTVIADYAIEQKGSKKKRGGYAAIGGGIALTAGVLGLIAISVATFGVAALVVGLAAALIGLGVLGYRINHSRKKRKAERKAFAGDLIAQVKENGAGATEAWQMISGLGMDPKMVHNGDFSKKLSEKVKNLIKTKREQMATDLVSHLVAGKPSEVFDAGLILGALGLNLAEIHQSVADGKSNKAVSKVADKLASW